jgi:hypothetical protein
LALLGLFDKTVIWGMSPKTCRKPGKDQPQLPLLVGGSCREADSGSAFGGGDSILASKSLGRRLRKSVGMSERGCVFLNDVDQREEVVTRTRPEV